MARFKQFDGKAAVVKKGLDGTLVESDDNTATFVLSNADVDRYGDVIDQKGWVLDNYKANPIVLFGHDATDVKNVMGTMINIKNDGTSLVGTVEFAPEGVNPHADMVRKLVAAKVLRTVSVGFKPLEAKAATDPQRKGGWNFTKQELLEVSIVPVPALPSALAKASAAGLDRDMLVKSGLMAETPAFVIKDFWTIGWLASLLGDGQWLLDWIDDDAAGHAELLAGLQSLGQSLCNMSEEALSELMAMAPKDDDGAEETGMKMAATLPNPLEIGIKQMLLAKSDLGAAVVLDTCRKHHLVGHKVEFTVDKAATQPIVRAGRVLSADNEAQLVSVKSILTDACEKVDKVLSQVALVAEDTAKPAETDADAVAKRLAIAEAKRKAL